MGRAVHQFHDRVTEKWLGHAGAAAPPRRDAPRRDALPLRGAEGRRDALERLGLPESWTKTERVGGTLHRLSWTETVERATDALRVGPALRQS